MTVNNTCSLADAITAANTDTATGGCPAGSGADTITLTANITLSAALPAISSDITVEGGGYEINGDGTYGIFLVNSGTFAINSLLLSGGRGFTFGAIREGGAIRMLGGSVTVNNSWLSSNGAGGSGGAIYQTGGSLTIRNSGFDGNSARADGGALASIEGASAPNITISGSYFGGNDSFDGNGGALDINNGTTLSVTNSFFVGNSADNGGALHQEGSATSSFTHVTITGNGENGVVRNSGTLNIYNSIIYGNSSSSASSDCVGTLNTNTRNIIQTGTCGTPYSTANPLLGNFVGFIGGSTIPYMPLQSGSPAIDAADPTHCPSTDIRGTSRPQGSACDIGAYEYVNPNPPPPTPTNLSVPGTTTTSLTLNWDAVAGADNYKVYLDGAELPLSVRGTIHTFTNLTAGTSYTLGVAAVGAGGTSATASITASTTATTTPTTLTVNATCTLDNAITAANTDTATGGCPAGSGADTITLTANITLNAALPDITSDITVDGTSSNFSINGDDSYRIFRLSSAGDLTLNRLTVTRSVGTAIFNRGTLTITNSVITNNTATSTHGSSDGAIENSGGTLIIINSTFSNNTGRNNGLGGAILNGLKGTLSITDSTFKNNSVKGNNPVSFLGVVGGAIFSSTDTTVTITNSSFTNNSAVDGGGAIYQRSGSIEIRNSTFNGNSASSGGAMVLVQAGGTANVEGSRFSNNTATENGGAIFVRGSGKVTLSNSGFSSNTARHGGAIYQRDRSHGSPEIEIRNSTFNSNSARENAGAIYIGDSARITNLTNVTMTGNNSGGDGGAIYIVGLADLTNVTMTGNSSGGDGGAIYNNNYRTELTHVTITGNSAENGTAGVHRQQFIEAFRNSIIYGNGSSDCGGKAPRSHLSSTGQNPNAHSFFGTDTCQVLQILPYLTADPLLGSLVSPTDGSIPYIPLQSGSPAIGAADSTYCPSTDIRGTRRPQGSHCDIGAYEYDSANPPPLPAPTNLSVSGITTTSLTLNWDAVAGAASYKVFLDGAELPLSVGGTSHTFTSLSAGTSYTLGVAAVGTGGTSATASIDASTSSTTSPPAPTNLSVSGTTTTSLTLNWDAVTGATSYKVYLDGAELPLNVGGTSHTFTSLSAGTSYILGVAAVGTGGTSGIASISASTSTITPTDTPGNRVLLDLDDAIGVTITYDDLFNNPNYVPGISQAGIEKLIPLGKDAFFNGFSFILTATEWLASQLTCVLIDLGTNIGVEYAFNPAFRATLHTLAASAGAGSGGAIGGGSGSASGAVIGTIAVPGFGTVTLTTSAGAVGSFVVGAVGAYIATISAERIFAEVVWYIIKDDILAYLIEAAEKSGDSDLELGTKEFAQDLGLDALKEVIEAGLFDNPSILEGLLTGKGIAKVVAKFIVKSLFEFIVSTLTGKNYDLDCTKLPIVTEALGLIQSSLGTYKELMKIIVEEYVDDLANEIKIMTNDINVLRSRLSRFGALRGELLGGTPHDLTTLHRLYCSYKDILTPHVIIPPSLDSDGHITLHDMMSDLQRIGLKVPRLYARIIVNTSKHQTVLMQDIFCLPATPAILGIVACRIPDIQRAALVIEGNEFFNLDCRAIQQDLQKAVINKVSETYEVTWNQVSGATNYLLGIQYFSSPGSDWKEVLISGDRTSYQLTTEDLPRSASGFRLRFSAVYNGIASAPALYPADPNDPTQFAAAPAIIIHENVPEPPDDDSDDRDDSVAAATSRPQAEQRVSTCENLPPHLSVQHSHHSMQCNVLSRAGVGHPDLVGSFIAGVDIWGYVADVVEVCIRGSGPLRFVDTSELPRSVRPLTAFSEGGMTCAWVERVGQVILVPGPPSPPKPTPGPATQKLSNCMVTLEYILNFRQGPGGPVRKTANGSDFWLPALVSLTAFERTAGWFYVDYHGERGWISADYVVEQGDCQANVEIQSTPPPPADQPAEPGKAITPVGMR